MKNLYWDSPDPLDCFDNPNCFFDADGIGKRREPGDPGYVPWFPPGYLPPISSNPHKPKHTRKMAELTDADQKAFIDKIIGTLDDAEIKARLTAAGWDPTQRATNLKNGKQTVTNDEGIISRLEAATTDAIHTRRTDLDNNYDLASATVSSIEGALGKDDPLVRDLRQYRGGLSHAPKKPPGSNP